MTSSMHGIAEPIHLHAQPKSTNAPFLQTYVTSHAVASTAPEGPAPGRPIKRGDGCPPDEQHGLRKGHHSGAEDEWRGP